jgi:hypothetical protein
MLKQRIEGVLAALLLLSGVVAVAFALSFAFSTRELRRLQPQVLAINTRLNVAQALLNDTLEYSKRNPAIDALLMAMKMKTNPLVAPPAAPRTK